MTRARAEALGAGSRRRHILLQTGDRAGAPDNVLLVRDLDRSGAAPGWGPQQRACRLLQMTYDGPGHRRPASHLGCLFCHFSGAPDATTGPQLMKRSLCASLARLSTADLRLAGLSSQVGIEAGLSPLQTAGESAQTGRRHICMAFTPRTQARPAGGTSLSRPLRRSRLALARTSEGHVPQTRGRRPPWRL